MCADEGVTGALPAEQRPWLLQALKMICSGDATALVVPSLDRLGRNLTTREAALALAWDACARIYSVDEGEIVEMIPRIRCALAFVRCVAWMHQLDRALISKRLRAGRQAKADKGGYVGGTVPYGFRLEDGQVIQDKAEQEVGQLVARLASTGASLRTIAAELKDLATIRELGRAGIPIPCAVSQPRSLSSGRGGRSKANGWGVCRETPPRANFLARMRTQRVRGSRAAPTD